MKKTSNKGFKEVMAKILLLAAGFWCAILVHAQDRPNIVWIVSEDNSAAYMQLFHPQGAPTPNIQKLAAQGIKFTHAFSNAPVCSAARSTIITGCYGPRLASHYHRQMAMVQLPPTLKMFPAYLREAGYYTANNSKEDYNVEKTAGVWDESSGKANWKKRSSGQPFFYVHNIGITHESSLHFTADKMKENKTSTHPDSVSVQPNHPNTPLFRYTKALYYDKIKAMDEEVGKVLKELRADGLLQNTIIFYYGDNGGVMPGSKGYLKNEGVHIPMIVYVPDRYKHLVPLKTPSTSEAFVSFVDLAPTVLNLAGLSVPSAMDGKPFLGKSVSTQQLNARNEAYFYADRMDEKYDMVRAIRIGKFKYNRNYEPFHNEALHNNYRYKQLAFGEWDSLYRAKKLNKAQAAFFEPKRAEALYNIDEDPNELNNLATSPRFAKELLHMRTKLDSMERTLPDLSFYPEFYLMKHAMSNPLQFGQQHKKDIHRYITIANWQLQDFKKVEKNLEASLKSVDPWERYWALLVCSSFGKKAQKFTSLVKQVAQSDKELINRVRAAEFLGLIKAANPADVMLQSLYNSKDGAEALLILNAITSMCSGSYNYHIPVDARMLNPAVLENSEVQDRLLFLEGVSPVAKKAGK